MQGLFQNVTSKDTCRPYVAAKCDLSCDTLSSYSHLASTVTSISAFASIYDLQHRSSFQMLVILNDADKPYPCNTAFLFSPRLLISWRVHLTTSLVRNISPEEGNVDVFEWKHCRHFPGNATTEKNCMVICWYVFETAIHWWYRFTAKFECYFECWRKKNETFIKLHMHVIYCQTFVQDSDLLRNLRQ